MEHVGSKLVWNWTDLCSVVGVVAGGGRIDKPILKAGRAYHKYKAKRNCWPRVRGVAMNVSPRTHTYIHTAEPGPTPNWDKSWNERIRLWIFPIICFTSRRCSNYKPLLFVTLSNNMSAVRFNKSEPVVRPLPGSRDVWGDPCV